MGGTGQQDTLDTTTLTHTQLMDITLAREVLMPRPLAKLTLMLFITIIPMDTGHMDTLDITTLTHIHIPITDASKIRAKTTDDTLLHTYMKKTFLQQIRCFIKNMDMHFETEKFA